MNREASQRYEFGVDILCPDAMWHFGLDAMQWMYMVKARTFSIGLHGITKSYWLQRPVKAQNHQSYRH